MSLNVFQKVYIKNETTFNGTTNDFTGGVKVSPTEKVKLDGFVQNLVDAATVKDGWDDVGGIPTQGLQEIKLDLVLLLSGATRAASVAQVDGLSTIFSWLLGSGVVLGNGTVGDGVNASTTEKIYTNDAYAVGDIIMINGEVRRIKAISGTEITLDIPLSAAPADGTTIYGVVYHVVTPGSVSSVGIGVEAEDAEMKYLGKGMVATGGFSFDFSNGEFAKATISLEGTEFERVANFTAPTTEAPESGVIVGNGGGVVLYDGTNKVSLCPSEVSVGLGINHEFIPCVVGSYGKGGFEAIPSESTVEITAYQDGTLSALENLVEKELSAVVQIGKEAGKVVGIYYPNAVVSVYPTPADIGSIQGVKISLKTAVGILFRG